MDSIKLGIAIPAKEQRPDWPFVDSLTALIAHTIINCGCDIAYLRPSLPVDYPASIDDVRNNLVVQAFEEDCTQLLMIDSDETCPPDVFQRLFAHGKPIVRARVHRRYPPFDPILLRKNSAGQYEPVPDEEWTKGGLVRVDATGVAACGLFDMRVFENIPPPWFATVRTKDGVVGEDVYFCEQAIKAGYEIFVDCDLEIPHLAQFAITQKFYNLYKAATR